MPCGEGPLIAPDPDILSGVPPPPPPPLVAAAAMCVKVPLCITILDDGDDFP